MPSHGDTVRYKIFGDRRDQRLVLREAGFADERGAASWALGLAPDEPDVTASRLVRRIRRAKPDLTLATARYIAGQAGVRR